jgi:hypothetical protein
METLIAYLASSFVAFLIVCKTTYRPERWKFAAAFLIAILPWTILALAFTKASKIYFRR